MTGGFFNTTVGGTGTVAVTSVGKPVVFECSGRVLTSSRRSCVRRLDTRHAQLEEHGLELRGGSGEAVQYVFHGPGFVVAQAYEWGPLNQGPSDAQPDLRQRPLPVRGGERSRREVQRGSRRARTRGPRGQGREVVYTGQLSSTRAGRVDGQAGQEGRHQRERSLMRVSGGRGWFTTSVGYLHLVTSRTKVSASMPATSGARRLASGTSTAQGRRPCRRGLFNTTVGGPGGSSTWSASR